MLVIGIGDLHIDQLNDNQTFEISKKESLIKSIKTNIREYPSDYNVLLVNGDIVNKGKVSSFDSAFIFLTEIKEELQKDCSSIDIILVPGNHDVDIKSKEKVKNNLDEIRAKLLHGDKSIDYSYIQQNDESLNGFSDLKNNGFPNSHLNKHNIFFDEYLYKNEKRNIRFITFNSTVFCEKNEDQQGKILVDKEELKRNMLFHETDIVLSSSHYPLDWYDRDDYECIDYIKKISDIIFLSHEHNGKSSVVHEDTKTILINLPKYCSIDDIRNIGYTVSHLDINDNTIMTEQYIFDGYIFSLQKESHKNYPIKKYQVIQNGIVSIEKSYIDNFSFLGDYIVNKNRLSLDDIYIEPELEYGSFNGQKDSKYFLEKKKLSEMTFVSSFYVILGDKSSGKTVLLRKIFTYCFSNGQIPLYINGSDLTNHLKGENGLKYIYQTFNNIYEDKDDILRQNFDKCCILVDNIDMINNNSKFIELVNIVVSKGGKIISTTSKSGYEKKLISFKDCAVKVEYWEIRQFNQSQLYEIVDKWYQKDTNLTDEERSTIVFKSKENIEKVAGNKLVTLNPLFTILLLEANDDNYVINLIESTKVVYYEYLINKVIIEVSNKSKIDTQTIKQYLQFIAYFLLKNNDYSYNELCTQFTNLYPIDMNEFKETIKELFVFLNNNNIILGDCKTEIYFCHDFVFYYFAASFLGKFSSQYKEDIINIIDNVHVEKNANTLSFLIQFINQDFIIDRIVEKTNSLFAYSSEIKCNNDILLINRLVNKLDKIEKYGDLKSNNVILNKEIDIEVENRKKMSDEEKEKLRKILDTELGINISKGVKYLQINGELLKQKLVKSTSISITKSNVQLLLRLLGDFVLTFKRALFSSFNSKGELTDKDIIYDGLEVFISLFLSGANFLGGQNNYFSVEYLIKDTSINSNKLLWILYSLNSCKDEDKRFDLEYIRKTIDEFDSSNNNICRAIIFFMIEFQINYVGISSRKLFEISRIFNINDQTRNKLIIERATDSEQL